MSAFDLKTIIHERGGTRDIILNRSDKGEAPFFEVIWLTFWT